ncbi:uracil-DNA glycosylase family protein [Streptomyces sp. NPDC085944]|uniref:uracil-DNA glycosylase family protein n=1 Tax=Streptomyces sp. NPDC085944 TaxID=3154962 RepID=UPI003431805F
MAGTEDAYTAEPFVPRRGGLPALHRAATQTVFGAGKLLDRALTDAGIDPADAYVTNAVKHFKFTRAEPGKRRIHKAPTLRETTACGPWPAAELDRVAPEPVVVLGATAGKALLGSSFRVTQVRGTVLEEEIHGRPERLVPTVHPPPALGFARAGRCPQAVLRSDDRDGAYRGLVSDLEIAARALG